mmetsp:Transcript_8256/g.30457  ORF Transcript_8256/g.30457 Transcript_8256/m.30457 type:complete len:200 (+) Transcript_8256:49-648(+)
MLANTAATSRVAGCCTSRLVSRSICNRQFNPLQAAGGRGARRRNARTYPAVKTQVVAEAGAEEKAPRTMAGNALNIGAVVGGTTVVIGGGTMLSHQLGIEEYTGPIGFFALLAGCAAWWRSKAMERDALKDELLEAGFDVEYMAIKNVGVMKWMKAEIDAGRSEELEAKIDEMYENNKNPWSAFWRNEIDAGKIDGYDK